MPTTLTARDRTRLLLAALGRVDDGELREGLDRLGARSDVPRPVVSAANAMRRSRALADALTRPPYRVVIPFLAASVADECLGKTITALGDSSDDPTREQLTEALETIRESFSEPTIAVMLASVATDEMPASELCLELLTSDERFGLQGWEREAEDRPSGDAEDHGSPTAATMGADDQGDDHGADRHSASPEQRAARQQRRREGAEARRRQKANARRAVEAVRSKRKVRPRSQPVSVPAAPAPSASPRPRPAPTLVRRARLTPAQAREFDADDPLVGALVFVWVPFSEAAEDVDPDPGAGREGSPETEEGAIGSAADASDGEALEEPEAETGKLRPCVVVGVSAGYLLVRPGYSDGGRKSRDWTSVAIGRWRQVGLDQPTWIGAETLRVPKPELSSPPARLATEDWNALW